MAQHSHICNTLQKAQKLSPVKVLRIIYPIALIFVGFPTNQDPKTIIQVGYKNGQISIFSLDSCNINLLPWNLYKSATFYTY